MGPGEYCGTSITGLGYFGVLHQQNVSSLCERHTFAKKMRRTWITLPKKLLNRYRELDVRPKTKPKTRKLGPYGLVFGD